jgi:anti-anti-sigma regulatory factor
MAGVEHSLVSWTAVTKARLPGALIVSIHGDLDIDSAPELRHYLLALVHTSIDALTLDVTSLACRDHADVALFYAARRDAGRRDVDLRIVPSPGRPPG